jgi:type IV secretion system protein TrbL
VGTFSTHVLLAGIVTSIVSAVLSAIAHAIGSGIVSLADWAIGGLAHAVSATTSVQLGSWFEGPWRAMLAVAALAALPLFFAGVLECLLHGEGLTGLSKVLGRLALAGVGSIVALALVQLLLGLVDLACGLVEHGSGISIGAALARLGTALGLSAVAGGGVVAVVGVVLLALVGALAALVLWLELALRDVLVLVATAFLPLGLAGLLWPKTASWLRRLGEILTAIAISKLVIVVVLVLGAAALTASPLSLSSPGADVDSMVSGVAFLGLATLGLPMALRVVPFAAEAALSGGRGGVLVRSGYAVSRLGAGVSSTSALIRRFGGGNTPGAGTPGDGTGPTPPPSRPAGGGPQGGGPLGGGSPGTPPVSGSSSGPRRSRARSGPSRASGPARSVAVGSASSSDSTARPAQGGRR